MSEKNEARRLRIRDLPAEERPIQRLERYGEGALSTIELLAIIIGTGHADDNVLQLAARLLSGHKNLHDLAQTPRFELTRIPGIGPVKAARLRATFELGRRLARPAMIERPRITSPAEAANLLMPEMRHLEQEHLVTLLLNTRNYVVDQETVYIGSLNSSLVRVAEVFRPAIRRNAAAILVAQNHPSGDPSPSSEDVAVTWQMAESGKLLDIELLDHLIIGRDRYVSLKERDLGFEV